MLFRRYIPFLSAAVVVATSEAFSPPLRSSKGAPPLFTRLALAAEPPAMSAGFDGKRVLPYRVLATGLKGQDQAVAAVYAVLNKGYKRGEDGWDAAVHIGVTQDLLASLECHVQEHGSETVAHVRALSFPVPQPNAMQQVAQDWKNDAVQAGATLDSSWAEDALSYLYDEEDDDEDEDFMEMTAEAMASVADDTIVSPFAAEGDSEDATSSGEEGTLEFNEATVNTVLDEVRPYLISDGGNVSVERVDPETRNVYLKLEGACGSCPSSTVTMQMGIERVLKENFENLGEVLQVDDDPNKPQELSQEAVEEEVNRLSGAVIAMGGAVRLLEVTPETGYVKMLYKGPDKVRQGLELAVQDVPFVETIEFVDEE